MSPNPSDGITKITYTDLINPSESLRIKVYNMQGVQLIDQPVLPELQGIEFDASSLPTGVYVAHLQDEQKIYLTGRLIKK